MSVYIKERPEYLEQCLHSLKHQSIPPSEVVIVQDGPIRTELKKVIEKWKVDLNIVDVVLPVNQGLGKALNIGLRKCSYELVARMDTDDLCLPTRFERQLEVFRDRDIDLVGSWVSEFVDNPQIIISVRKVPSELSEIKKVSQYKNPLNHPSVMYKKSIIEKYGSYEDVFYFEDYYLWLKLLKNNVRVYNIQEPLVNMRAGLDQLARRSGRVYANREIYFLGKSVKNRYIGKRAYLINLILRVPSRLLPVGFIKLIYRQLRS